MTNRAQRDSKSTTRKAAMATTPTPTPYTYNSQEVRVLLVNDEPWFVLADLCTVLGLSNPSMVAERLDNDALSTAEVIDKLGRKQQARITSEAGMYQAAFMSRKPEAEVFRRWVTHEVLPQIRRTGRYAAAAGATAPQLSGKELLAAAVLEATETIKQREATIESQQAELEAARPKVLFADAVAASRTDILVGDLAKILRGNGIQIGATRLFAWLRRHGYLIRREGSDWNMSTQRAMEAGLFRVKETAITHADGHVSVSKTPKLTGKGQQYFVDGFLSGAFSLEVAE